METKPLHLTVAGAVSRERTERRKAMETTRRVELFFCLVGSRERTERRKAMETTLLVNNCQCIGILSGTH